MKKRCGQRVALVGVTGGVTLLLLSGCTSFRGWNARKRAEHGVLLAPRTIVPAPYAEPPPAPAGVGAPVEPALPPIPTPPVVEKKAAPEEISLPPPVETKELTHKVAKGESFWKIAVMYGVSQDELAAYNHMSLKEVLAAGKVLRIPPGGQFIPPENRPKFKPQKKRVKKTSAKKTGTGRSTRREPLPPSGKYTVKSGDSLWRIAHRYGLKTEDIRRANNLKTDTLQIGQVLVLPAPTAVGAPNRAAAPSAAAGGVAPVNAETPAGPTKTEVAPKTAAKDVAEYPKKLEHEVGAGETLEGIAEMYGVKVEAIKKANPKILSDKDLTPKAILIIPYP